MREETKKWLDKAKDDLKKANDNFKIRNYDLSSFLCQQSVEKAFKAALIEKTREFPKIHDLVKLGRLLEVPENLIEYAKELTLAYIYSRYPDVDQGLDLKEKASKFLKQSREILKWVKENL